MLLVMPGYFSPYKIFNADAELYNIIIQGTLKALIMKALIMRDYDTTNITLIRQSRKQLVRIIVRLVGIENKTNLRAKQQSGKRHHYEESVEKATKKKLSV